LIGASIGLAVRERKLAKQVIGIGRTISNLTIAQERGAVDLFTTNLAEGVQQAQLTIICTPIETIAEQAIAISQASPVGALITDAGSTKAGILTELGERLAAGTTFIGSHPLAGSEKTGAEFARADLLVNRVVVVTPTPATPPDKLAAIREFWEALGARVVEMSPEQHDAAVAATSHLPHMVSTALAVATPLEFLELVAGGWLDTTRIAGGDAELWRQILLANRDHSLRALDKFEKVLSGLRTALQNRDGDALRQLLEAGKQTRDAVGS
ncbi:MAG TPA: prephenate dehydrogenase/arogenate dehydrogenase family protein, partial [Pirellulaceae bacterium]|nr:prephenate dehydrogenase/arogenate dehydrogenase family protein [Pirellulaceae bacterium]